MVGQKMKTLVNGSLATLPEHGDETLEGRIRKLEDVRAVEETIFHYARRVDMRDASGVAAVFTDQGCLRGPGLPAVQGRQRIERLYRKLLPQMTSSTHVVSNVQVWLNEPDHAIAYGVLWAWEGFGTNLTFQPGQTDNRFSLGRYEFALVRDEEGQWLISDMHVSFAGQTVPSDTPAEAIRYAEQLDRPWPPQPHLSDSPPHHQVF